MAVKQIKPVNLTVLNYFVTNYKLNALIEVILKEYENTNCILLTEELLSILGVDIDTIRNNLPFKTKLILQTKHYDYEKEEWIGKRGFWLDKIF